jgi:hypothetical protein
VDQSFPKASSEGYDIRSKPIFMLTRRGENGEAETEVVVMEAEMHVTTEAPQKNENTGRQQVDLTVDRWVARGHSRLLGTEIVMELDSSEQKSDEGSEALRSTVIAKGRDGDFPAQLTFNMAYTISAPALGYKSSKTLRSTAAGPIRAFPPPSDSRFEITGKELSIADIDIDPIMCAC